MGIRLAVALLGVALLIPASASAEAPGVSRPIAENITGKLLRSKYPTWLRKRFGFIDCRRGRINRTQWSCEVGWVARDGRCFRGRIRVVGEGYSAYGEPLYKAFGGVRRTC